MEKRPHLQHIPKQLVENMVAMMQHLIELDMLKCVEYIFTMIKVFHTDCTRKNITLEARH